MKKVSVLFLPLLIVFASACNKDKEGAYRLNVIAKSAKSSSATFQLNSASCYVTELELEADDDDYRDDDDRNEIDLEGRYLVDLLTGNSSPALPEIDVVSANYDELEIEFGEDDDQGIYSFRVEGSYNDGSNDIPVIIEIEEELSYELEDDNGISIDEDLTSQILITVDLQSALAAVDFSQAQIQNGSIIIDDDNNTSLYSDFVDALELELDD